MNLTSDSDTLLRHERSHANPTPQSKDTEPNVSQPAQDHADGSSHRQSLMEATPDLSFTLSASAQNKNYPPISQSYSLDASATDGIPATSAEPSRPSSLQTGEYGFSHLNQDPPLDSWLLADDFDIDALDNALAATMADWVQMYWADCTPAAVQPRSSLPLSPSSLPSHFNDVTKNRNSMSTTAPTKCAKDFVSKQWFTRLQPQRSRFQSRAASEEPSDHPSVNEKYRDKLSRTLIARSLDAAIPPVEYLSLYLRLYSQQFHPLFPVVHLPKFRPDSQHSLLFLSMCSIGSLFVRSPSAALQGRGIFERLNKVILASWETHLANDNIGALVMVQAALLGQTFGMLSGRPKELITVDSFHGTLLTWARRIGIPQEVNYPLPFQDIRDAEKERRWNDWVDEEQKIRITLALMIHDAELSSLLHRESTLRWNAFCRLPRLANDALFKAPTAEKWYSLLQEQISGDRRPFPTLRGWMNGEEDRNPIIHRYIQDSSFSAYSMLECINIAITESRQSDTLDPPRTKQFESRLLVWYKLYHQAVPQDQRLADPYQLTILWHCTFMSLCADFDLLEVAMGRDGPEKASYHAGQVREWALAASGVRCLYHCLLLQEQVVNMRLGSEPALHVPRAVFSAGLVAFSCSGAMGSGERHQWSSAEIVFPETGLLDHMASSCLAEATAIASDSASMKCLSMVYNFIDLLQKLDRWGLSQSLAQTLLAALEGNGEAIVGRPGVHG
jgi:hypothetical protein